MKTPDITVAIPTYNREEILLDTIHEILDQSYKNLELIIIDQSKEHTKKITQSIFAIDDRRFRYFKVDPACLPAARNFALQVAKAPIVLFLDDDIKPHKDLVSFHINTFRNNPALSAVGGRVLQKDFLIQKKVLRFDRFAIPHGTFTATQADYTNTFPGGNHSIKVIDALSVGGYDTRYYQTAFREESDMSAKMTKKGMVIYYEPKAELLHLNASSGGTRERKYTGHIFDTSDFYKNELFFTLRTADDPFMAILKKYQSYCTLSLRYRNKRKIFFCLGLIVAFWRLCFGKQIVTKVRNT